MSETAPSRHHLALLQGVSPIDRARIPADVLAGTPVPQEVHIEHVLLTRDNIAQYYP